MVYSLCIRDGQIFSRRGLKRSVNLSLFFIFSPYSTSLVDLWLLLWAKSIKIELFCFKQIGKLLCCKKIGKFSDHIYVPLLESKIWCQTNLFITKT